MIPGEVAGEFPIQLKTKTHQITEELQSEVQDIKKQLQDLQTYIHFGNVQITS